MNASQYITLGATLAAAVLLLTLVVALARGARRRAHRARDAGTDAEPSREWLPPATPAPLDQLASASLESRIAAWVSSPPQSGTDPTGLASARTEVAAPLPARPAPLRLVDLGAAVPEPEGVRATGPAGEAEPLLAAYAPAQDAPPLVDESTGSGHSAVAPVELWIDGTRVLVDSDDESSGEFRRYANELLGDLARTRRP